MSATNSTPIINLPIFIGTDKPAWLVDWNNAMNIIDSNISALQSAESGTAASLAALSQSVQALSGTVDQHTTALQTATQAIAGNTGSINTINSLIGNGQPTTTDKTIIGAINEINAKIPEGGEVAADDVTYDNASSGLKATDVQAAIDEVNAKIPAGGAVEADDVVYSNAASGLAATDVQAAIDTLCTPSATEKVVGKTADGNLIYEKVISADNQNLTTTTTIDASITKNNSKIIGMDLIVKDSSGYKSAFDAYADNTLYQATPRVTENGVLLVISGSTIFEYYLTIRYVKVSA